MRSTLCACFALLLGACGSGHRDARAYVSNENDGTVSVIDLHAGKTIATIPVGKRPRGLKVVGRTLYVALSGTPKGGPGVDESKLPPPDRSADGIGVVDLDTQKLVRTIESGPDPESFDVADAHTLVVSNEDAGEASIVDIDSGKIRAHFPVGGEPEGVRTAPDGTVWVTSERENTISVLDPKAGTVLAKIATGLRPRTIGFGATIAAVGGENDGSITLIDIKQRTPVARLQLPLENNVLPRPMGVAISPDGKLAYVTTGRSGSIVVVDLLKKEIAKTIENVGKRPWGIAVDRDGLVYTANGPSDDLSVIDPGKGRVLRRIHTGGSPWGVSLL